MGLFSKSKTKPFYKKSKIDVLSIALKQQFQLVIRTRRYDRTYY